MAANFSRPACSARPAATASSIASRMGSSGGSSTPRLLDREPDGNLGRQLDPPLLLELADLVHELQDIVAHPGHVLCLYGQECRLGIGWIMAPEPAVEGYRPLT